MKKILFILLASSMVLFAACNKDDVKKAPVVTAPAAQSVLIKGAIELTFNFTAEAGYKSAVVAATNGTAEVTTDAAAGAASGTITVTFTAAETAGAGSVTITVTGNDSQTGVATAVINVSSVPTISVTENISANTTWTKDNIYILEGRIAVLDGATLTINAGTIVKGREGTDVNATALIITRGGKIMAEGTAAEPIIFTSIKDNIIPGEIVSPNLEPTDFGLWGGVIVLGKARSSFKADVSEFRIEGIPISDPNGYHGGTNDADNSGVIKYVSIRHGGSLLGEGNEINGLTLGSVGSGTIIENVEVIGNADDGIEWFGGAVNVKNVVVWNADDDAIDTDMSWRGTLDNFVVINPGDKCFEADGPEGTLRIDGLNYTIKNGIVAAGDAAGLVDNDANTNVNMNNMYFYDVKSGQTFDLIPTDYTSTFANFEVTLPAGGVLTDYFLDGTDAYTTAVAAGANTVGATLSAFDGWSWARVSGAF
ncbi:MAG: hypothetical protein P1P88_09580 [Bacteroidales bacterium]|nr:hypothetical protein [Bacteroidales bacterium]